MEMVFTGTKQTFLYSLPHRLGEDNGVLMQRSCRKELRRWLIYIKKQKKRYEIVLKNIIFYMCFRKRACIICVNHLKLKNYG